MRRLLAGQTTEDCRRLLMLMVLLGLCCKKSEEPISGCTAPEVVTTKSGLEMVLVPAGRFEMGSHSGQTDQSPVHTVWVGAFLMARYETTQEQYGRLVLGNPSHFKGPDRPVEQVSWADAALYCNKLSGAEGLEPCYNEETAECNFEADGYRLPTEAEWEYACRAGTNGPYHFGGDARRLKQYAWFAGNSSNKTHAVGQKKPNPWGLFDLHGNVAEWCNDVYDKDYYKVSPEKNPRGPAEGEKYVLRGGAWNSSSQACRPAGRVGEDPGFQDACFARDAIGFRCVRNAPAGSEKNADP